MKKKLLSIVLSLCMILTLLPTFALAEAGTNVASITKDNVTTNYTTLADAVAAAQSGDTIKLLANVTVGTMIMLNKTITLDLNGYKISTTGNDFVQVIGGATLTIDGTKAGSELYGRINVGIATNNNGNVVLNGGTYSCKNAQTVLHINGTCHDSDVTIKNATITSPTDNGIQLNGAGTFVIENSTITGATAVYVKSGTLTIKNSTLTGTMSPANYNYNGNGANATGDAIVVDSCNYPGGKPVVTIESGNFSGTKAAIGSYTSKGSGSSVAVPADISVSGGYFTTDPSAYVASGYYTATSDKTGYPYMVKSGYAASIGTTQYSTLAAAVAAAQSGDTITLLADVTLDSTVITHSDKSLTLDLNGHTITGASKKTAIICGGTLTIKDSGTTGSIKSSYVAVAVQDNAVLTIESGNLDSVEGAVITGYATGSAITINGGTFSASDNAVIAGNGNKTNSEKSDRVNANTITINGGTFNGGITTSGYVACGIYAPWKDTINVTGGTFNITGGAGIVARAGNVNISGGTFKTTGNVTGKVGDSRVVVPCSALVFDSEAKYYAMTNESKISVTGGYFNSAVSNVATVPTTDVARVSVSGGYFTTDPSAYVVSSKIVGTSDKTGYTYMVKAVEANVKVDVGNTVANPVPSTAPDYSDLEKVTVAPDASDTGLTAAGGNVASNVTEQDKTAATTALDTAGVTTTDKTVTIVVQPKLEVTPQSYDSTDKELTLDIKAVYDEIATTAAEPNQINTTGVGGTKNATVTKENQPMTVPDGTPVVIKVAIPEAMAGTPGTQGNYSDLQIKHVKENGAIYYYTANVTKEAEVYYATFTVTHGFSEFTLMSADKRTLEVTYDSNGGSAIAGSPVTYSITDVGTTLPVPTKTGYTFTGWKFSDNLGEFGVYTKLTNDLWTTLMTGINPGATRKISATAQFSALPTSGSAGGGSTTDKYTLSFETNGGSAVKAVTAEKNAVIDLTKYAPTKEGYDFSGWYSDSKLTTAVTSVTMTKDITVYAKWTEKSQTAKLPFTDVPETAYYRDAVAWAVEKGVTSGVTATTFAPDRVCTRAETVTFLWRAMGSPEPTAANNPFTDVSANDYYYKAVLWAVEKGITKGTSDTTFSPAAPVTRAQTVTFLWRAAGMPAQSGSNPFTDVQTGAFYTDAVLWAGSEGITEGTGTTTFSPNLGCTRAQIVTFLYRYLAK